MTPSPPENRSYTSAYIADRLRVVKKTPADLAQVCGLTSPRTAEALLDGSVKPPLHLLPSIAQVIEVDVAELQHRYVEEFLPELASMLPDRKSRSNALTGDLMTTIGRGMTVIAMVDPSGCQHVRERDALLIPTLRVRNALATLPEPFSCEQAAETLLLRRSEAQAYLEALTEEDFLSRVSGAEALWQMTEAGRQLVDAHGPHPIKREQAVEIFGAFLNQVAQVNAQSHLPYRVAGVNLIGETLTAGEDEDIPHVEITVTLQERFSEPEQQEQAVIESAERVVEGFRAMGETQTFVLSKEDDVDLARMEIQNLLRDCGVPVCLRWHYEALQRWRPRRIADG